jgi:hypothetical protein
MGKGRKMMESEKINRSAWGGRKGCPYIDIVFVCLGVWAE